MRLVKQNLGAKLAIGVYGTPEEINGRMASLVQWGAGESALHLGAPESFQYVIATEERLIAYFVALEELKHDPDVLDEAPFALHRAILNNARQAVAIIPPESFLNYGAEYFERFRVAEFEMA